MLRENFTEALKSHWLCLSENLDAPGQEEFVNTSKMKGTEGGASFPQAAVVTIQDPFKVLNLEAYYLSVKSTFFLK